MNEAKVREIAARMLQEAEDYRQAGLSEWDLVHAEESSDPEHHRKLSFSYGQLALVLSRYAQQFGAATAGGDHEERGTGGMRCWEKAFEK